MELEFEKYCVVDGSPTTVLPPRSGSKVQRRKSKTKVKCENEMLSVNERFTEISFRNYRSVSCKSVPSRKINVGGNEILRRGSVYQSSKELSKIRQSDAVDGRRKIEFSRSSATAFPFGIVDALCSSDEDSLKSSSVMPKELDARGAVNSKDSVDLSCEDFQNPAFRPAPESGVPSDCTSLMSFDSDKRASSTSQSALDAEITPGSIGSIKASDNLKKRDPTVSLPKSLSAKLALPHSPARSDSDCSKVASPKIRSSPVRKMFDPFVKSKSQRSPLSSASRSGMSPSIGTLSINQNRAFRKSLLQDFSNTARDMQCSSQPAEKEDLQLIPHFSPAHLHGILRVEMRYGVPIFDFSLNFPEENFIAKSWKVENTLNWVYTFHSVHSKRRSNVNGLGLKDYTRASSLVGQMQVSCYLCTDVKEAQDSLVTEFVLYDMVHQRKIASQDVATCLQEDARGQKDLKNTLPTSSAQPINIFANLKIKDQMKHAHVGVQVESPLPRPADELYPDLEVAATIIQVPFEKRESLKMKRDDLSDAGQLPSLLDLSEIKPRKSIDADSASPARVGVAIPYGHHSLPYTKDCRPSKLIDRWRSGGGCDCGGWDMACPLNILGNSEIRFIEYHPLLDNQQPMELFLQGSKNNIPALTMRAIEDGKYKVDFHAQLSGLQAFSICVAILHATESSVAIGQESNKQPLQCDSSRIFTKEEVKSLVDAISKEENIKVQKKTEPLPSFVINPPFSPIGRV